MKKIDISLIAPSVRPQLWERFCDSLKDTKINWEVIFIGDKPPIPGSKLPPNLRWINSSVKPSQATHIGFIEAKGEIVCLTADDATYFTPYAFDNYEGSALDKMYYFIKNFKNLCPNNNIDDKKIIYGFRMFEDHSVTESTWKHRLNYYYKGDKPKEGHPLLYPFFAIYKQLYFEVGGYDKNFITGQAENDFQMRVAIKYSHTDASLCPVAFVHAHHELGHKNKGKFRDYYHQDRTTLVKLWGNNPEYLILERRGEVESYINNKSIYYKSQGNIGEWK